MLFNKKGIIFKPDNSKYWQNSHAALPTLLKLTDSTYRVFFTSRDNDNKTYVGCFDWSAENPLEVFNVSENPVLLPGKLGCFDAFGVQATSVVKHNDDLYMYYLGWVVGQPAPLFYTAIGLAISKDNGQTFQKYSQAPIMERSPFDPWMVSGGTVFKQNNKWLMYYISGIAFNVNEDGAESTYDVKLAESIDGINWNRNGVTPFPLNKNETNISRIAFIQENDVLKAWFPVKKRGQGYRCGYAESVDSINFVRKDNLSGITISESGWDNYSIDKMDVIKHNEKYYMFYNGNSFGKDGIGLAIYEN